MPSTNINNSTIRGVIFFFICVYFLVGFWAGLHATELGLTEWVSAQNEPHYRLEWIFWYFHEILMRGSWWKKNVSFSVLVLLQLGNETTALGFRKDQWNVIGPSQWWSWSSVLCDIVGKDAIPVISHRPLCFCLIWRTCCVIHFQREHDWHNNKGLSPGFFAHNSHRLSCSSCRHVHDDKHMGVG